MRDIYPDILKWHQDGQTIALATVIKTWGSSPRTTGAKMAVNELGEMTGSVSGGCVEGAVVAACADTIASGQPQLLHFDVDDETAWDVGIGCGGELDVFIRLLSDEVMTAFSRSIEEEDPLALTTLVRGPQELVGKEIGKLKSNGSFGSIAADLDARLTARMAEGLKENDPLLMTIEQKGEVFIDIMPPPPTLVIVGGVHIAIALVKMAKASGYRTIIVDPRRQFGTQVRFPEADRIIQKWPDDAFKEIKLTGNTAVAMLTHDPKIDDPGLIAALPSEAFYVGALGSKKTQASRRQRLREAGVNEELLARLHGPIGLDLGGRSPEEIALAIMAEIVQKRYR